MTITSLRTPCVLIDRPTVDRNIDRMQAVAAQHRVRLRPHAKTHKSPDIALLQIARGAAGICCAKIGEAEVFADTVRDVRLPYPLHHSNADRLLALADRTRVSFVVDSLDVARGWSQALHTAGREIDVLVKVDVGLHRCGIDPGLPDAAEFVLQVAELRGLRLRGLLSHAGHSYAATSASEIEEIARAEARVLVELRDELIDRGLPMDEISVGATPTARFSAALDGITELRPGNYVYYDRMQVALGSAAWEDCALTVLSRVVSRPASDRLILDAGSKTLTSDLVRGGAGGPGYGAVLRELDARTPDDRLVIERLSEEHAVVRADDGTTLAPGDLVRIVPNHACVVSNMVDEAWMVSGMEVHDRLRITARGRIT